MSPRFDLHTATSDSTPARKGFLIMAKQKQVAVSPEPPAAVAIAPVADVAVPVARRKISVDKSPLKWYQREVNYHDSKMIRALKRLRGARGFLIYDYFADKVYSESGYFFHYDRIAAANAAADNGLSPQELQEELDALFELGLFDADKFKEHGILTSETIQETAAESFEKLRKTKGMMLEMHPEIIIDAAKIAENRRKAAKSGEKRGYMT